MKKTWWLILLISMIFLTACQPTASYNADQATLKKVELVYFLDLHTAILLIAAAIGLVQWLMIKSYDLHGSSWLVWFYISGALIASVINYYQNKTNVTAAMSFMCGFVGFWVGFGTWLTVLRTQVKGGLGWILANLLGWGLAAILFQSDNSTLGLFIGVPIGLIIPGIAMQYSLNHRLEPALKEET
ncbi:MAG TPA: hypothetical protein VIO61_03460 [Anaerolineaceae bacterium]